MNQRLCSIEGCSNPHDSRGWCSTHWTRWRKHGDPHFTLLPNLMTGTAEERFWAKVEKTSSCWLWSAMLNSSGYGKFWDGTQKVLAHRFSYEMSVGPIPTGLQLDHLCRVRKCVNPDHLEAVSSRVNTLRGLNFAAVNARKTECPSGHPYSDDNTYVDVKGRRYCRACRRLRDQARRERGQR